METDGTNISVWCGTATIVAEEESPKGKIVETTERYDKGGKLVEKIVREIAEDEKAKPYIAPWADGSTAPSGSTDINHLEQCAEQTGLYVSNATKCCMNASAVATTALPSETHG